MQDTPTLRIRIDLAYDGSGYHGWARQPNLPSVQEAIETSLATIFREPIKVTVAGRTDAGVHAAQQVTHCDVPSQIWQKLPGNTPGLAPEIALVSKLNGVLASQRGAIRILRARIAPEGFDARFSPISRSYTYRVALGEPNPLTRHFITHHRKPLNVPMMRQEIQGLEGLHDFGSFCKPREGATTWRTLQHFSLQEEERVLTINLSADAFCHHMVRALVGALLQVGDGTRTAGWLRQRLANPVRDSHMAIAPAHGLVLGEVHYPHDDQVGQRAVQTRAKRNPTDPTCD